MAARRLIPLSSGAELRVTGDGAALAVVCVNGGQGGSEWLVGHYLFEPA